MFLLSSCLLDDLLPRDIIFSHPQRLAAVVFVINNIRHVTNGFNTIVTAIFLIMIVPLTFLLISEPDDIVMMMMMMLIMMIWLKYVFTRITTEAK